MATFFSDEEIVDNYKKMKKDIYSIYEKIESFFNQAKVDHQDVFWRKT